jgi:hypothetical protein
LRHLGDFLDNRATIARHPELATIAPMFLGCGSASFEGKYLWKMPAVVEIVIGPANEFRDFPPYLRARQPESDYALIDFNHPDKVSRNSARIRSQ